MHISSISALSLLLGAAVAKRCLNQTVSVTISSRNGVFGDIPVPQTNSGVVNITLEETREGQNFTQVGLTGYKTVHGTYKIETQFCSPDYTTAREPVLQILTHGIGFDRTYWDVAYDGFRYSYTNNAVDQHKFYTLSYDRLGIGQSQHGEPRDEIQSFLEIAALKALTQLVRSGKFPGIKTKFCKIVHVGHSFGSAQTFALTAGDPTISDGIVLTGFSVNGSFTNLFTAGGQFQEAALNNPQRLGKYPKGYFVTANEYALEYEFLLPGYFDPKILSFLESSKQPVTLGEQLTLGSVPKVNKFANPVLVFTGSNDLPYCGGNCVSTGGYSPNSIPAGVKAGLPNVKKFAAYIQPRTGHGLTVHHNATAGFDLIARFLKDHGLGSR